MKHVVWALVISLLASIPARAQDVAVDRSRPLDLGPAVLARAFAISAQQPAPPGSSPRIGSRKVKDKAIYFASLAGAVAGLAYNIKTTRDALDRHLEARTFPLVWQKTRDPKDKGKVTGIIVGTNGAMLGLGAVLYARGDMPIATFINALVGGATTIIGLHNQSIINDCKETTCQ